MLSNGVEVTLSTAGGWKEEFSPQPERGLPTSNSNERYVLAENNERFVLRYTIDPAAVLLQGATTVRVDLKIDGGVATGSKLVQMTGCFNGPISVDVIEFQALRNKCRQMCAFAFSEMQLDEDLDLSIEEVDRQISTLGLIEVTAIRGYSWNEPRRAAPLFGPAHTEAVVSSKHVIKERGVTHGISTPELRNCGQPGPTQPRFIPLPIGARMARFTFRYRSLMCLGVKKIISHEQWARLLACEEAKLEQEGRFRKAREPGASRTNDHSVLQSATKPAAEKSCSVEGRCLKRTIEQVEILDMTDGASPSRSFESTHHPRRKDANNDLIPFRLQGSNCTPSSRGPERKRQRRAENADEERLQLQLETNAILQRLLGLESA